MRRKPLVLRTRCAEFAGLFLKDAKLEPDLGSMLARMLSPLSDRGPDSAGFAVYGAETPGHVKFTLRLPPTADVDGLLKSLRDELGEPIAHRLHGTHVVVAIPADRIALARRVLAAFADIAIVGAGRRMEIFKEVGRPDDVSATVRARRHAGHPRHRPYQDGNGIGCDHQWRPPFHHGR